MHPTAPGALTLTLTLTLALALGASGRRTVGPTNRSTLLEGSLRHTSRNG